MPACHRLPPHSRGPGVLARWHTARQPHRLADLVTLLVRRVVAERLFRSLVAHSVL